LKKQKPIGKKKCYFCSETKNLERHHCFQLMFKKYYEGNIDEPENLVWLCSSCHYKIHRLNEGMLSTLKKHLNPKKGEDHKRHQH